MNQTDLPNICFVMNIVEKLQWEVMNRLRKEANGIILNAQNPLDNPKAINFVSRVRQSAYALTYFDSLLVTEYIYNSLMLRNTEAVIDDPYIILRGFINTMMSSSTSSYSIRDKVMGFTWSNSKNERLFSSAIADVYLHLPSILGLRSEDSIICKYDLLTILKVIKTYYQAHGRKVFREYYEQESRRERLYTYQIAPEITESYILGRCASTGDPNDPAIYRGIIKGVE